MRTLFAAWLRCAASRKVRLRACSYQLSHVGASQWAVHKVKNDFLSLVYLGSRRPSEGSKTFRSIEGPGGRCPRGLRKPCEIRLTMQRGCTPKPLCKTTERGQNEICAELRLYPKHRLHLETDRRRVDLLDLRSCARDRHHDCMLHGVRRACVNAVLFQATTQLLWSGGNRPDFDNYFQSRPLCVSLRFKLTSNVCLQDPLLAEAWSPGLLFSRRVIGVKR